MKISQVTTRKKPYYLSNLELIAGKKPYYLIAIHHKNLNQTFK
jgi:hypothetical protein